MCVRAGEYGRNARLTAMPLSNPSDDREAGGVYATARRRVCTMDLITSSRNSPYHVVAVSADP